MTDDERDLPAPPLPPSRTFRSPDGSPHPGYLSPGARKEKLRQQRAGVGVAAPEEASPRRRRAAPPPYAELRAASAFSFLDGASLPEDLVARAAELELPAVALVDRSGVYGAPRFYKAAKSVGLRALVGAEVPLAVDALLPFAPPVPLGAQPPSRESGVGGDGRRRRSGGGDPRTAAAGEPATALRTPATAALPRPSARLNSACFDSHSRDCCIA